MKITLFLLVIVFIIGNCIAIVPPPGLYDLLAPYNETDISLEQLLDEIHDTPGGRALLEKMVEKVYQTTGYNVSSYLPLFFNNSRLVLNYTSLSILDLSLGFTAANLGYWVGNLSQINTSFPKIPTSPYFAFPEQIYTTPFNLSDWKPTLDYLGDNLFWGFPFQTNTSDEQVRINVIMSLLFNQLADNIHLSPSSPSYTLVSFNNQTYHSAHAFLSALLTTSSDWSISGFLEWHIAQFFGIYTNASAPSYPLKSVADPVMQYTGIYSKDPNSTAQAILPAAHSQWVFKVLNKKTGFYFQLEWYQGDTSYGFYPGELYIYTDWSGRRTAKNIDGQQAVQAVKYMEYVKDVFVTASEKKNLYDGGYGVIGVCDDSCAVVELLLGYETTELYPFLIQKQLVVPELLERIQKRGDDLEVYYEMLKMVNRLPVDWAGINDSSVRRANDSIVWMDGKYPWQCVVDATNIFAQYK